MQIRNVLYLLLLFPAVLAAGDTPLTYDRIDLSVSVNREVENDTLVAVLFAQKEGNDTTRLASEVNRLIATAVRTAKQRPEVRVQTPEYRTTPIYNKQYISGWRVYQSIRLESTNAGAVSALIGELQKTLGLESISYNLSPKSRAQIEAELIRDGIAAFKKRAELISSEIGRPGYRLVQMAVNTSGASPRPFLMRAAQSTASLSPAPPALEAGTQQVEVTINGTIELQP
jgi:predicted secreted protein